ncbi:MAG: nucleotide exchange factor GrpE [Parachlamydiaceae bacterium]|nr:nucleotide exchange factor GrpE [Parachlamydiaceae bacterium]
MSENINLPEELQEKYDNLSLPSLYDYLLTQEKLSVEIRKQNQEVKALREQCKELKVLVSDSFDELNSRLDENDQLSELQRPQHSDEFNGNDKLKEDLNEEEDFENEDEEDVSEVISPEEVIRAQQLLMHAMDSLFNLYQGIAKGNEKILETLPSKEGFWRSHKPLWRSYVEEALSGYEEGVNAMRQKLVAQMADLDVSLINPGLGTIFDPVECRAIETVQGGPKGRIAQVIRFGYKIKGKIARCADVAIYKEK